MVFLRNGTGECSVLLYIDNMYMYLWTYQAEDFYEACMENQ